MTQKDPKEPRRTQKDTEGPRRTKKDPVRLCKLRQTSQAAFAFQASLETQIFYQETKSFVCWEYEDPDEISIFFIKYLKYFQVEAVPGGGECLSDDAAGRLKVSEGSLAARGRWRGDRGRGSGRLRDEVHLRLSSRRRLHDLLRQVLVSANILHLYSQIFFPKC